MDPITLILTIVGIIIALVFGYLQVIVPFTKKEVKFAKKFPFVVSTTEITLTKIDTKAYAKVIGEKFPIPAERKPIAVMPFRNLTGEASYDYLTEAIPNLLITNLEQSNHLSVMTWERMHDLVEILGKENMQVIDDKLGFELCKLDGINNIVLGSFTRAGNLFATDLKVLEVSSKQLLRTANSKGEGIDSILRTQIDELSTHISHGVGLSEGKVKESNLRIADVTTSSIDAYNYFLRGREDLAKGYYGDARKFLEKAIELDPTFASAYLQLAWANLLLGDYKASAEAREQAKALSEKATEKERLYIEADYASHTEGSFEKRVQILKQLTATYPKEKAAHFLLGRYYYTVERLYSEAVNALNIALDLDPYYGSALNQIAYTYTAMGNFDKAIEYAQRYEAVLPGEANPFDTMGDIYFQMGETDKAFAKYKEAMEAKPDFGEPCLKIAYISALKEEYAEAMKWVDREIKIAPSSVMKARRYYSKALYECHLGSFKQALKDLDVAKDLVKPAEWEYVKTAANWHRGWVHYIMGDYELSRICFEDRNTVPYHSSWDSAFITIEHNFPLGLVDAKQGNLDPARKILAAIKSILPDVIPWFKEYAQLAHDVLHAEILLAEDSFDKVLIEGEKLSKQDVNDAYTGNQIVIIKDIVARVYIRKGDIDRAILEYERLTDPDPNKRGRCLIRPTWRYELAKLYEEKGMKAKAIQQHERFLEVWKNADADRPELIDAKKRLARLKAG